jgi:hypothetical protein
MKFFNGATPMTPTGTDVLREALRIRTKKGHTGSLARDLNIGIAALDEFAHGKGKLPDAIMSALAQHIFGSNVTFDAEQNLLKRAKPASIPAAVPPPRFVPTPKVYPTVAPMIPSKPAPVQPKGRAGWAD